MHTSTFTTSPPTPEASINAAVVQALDSYRHAPGNLLPVLHAIQDKIGYIPPSCVPTLAQALNRSRAEIHGVISFYAHFRQTPAAPIKLEICRAEACQSMGGQALAAHAVNVLGCHFKDTSRDGRINLEPVYCLGLCAQAPAIALDGTPHARMTPDRLEQLLNAGHSDKAAKVAP